jgi:hypothetical protein
MVALFGLTFLVFFNGCNNHPTKSNQVERYSETMMREAKQTYLEMYLIEHHPNATIDDISFKPLFGIFDECLVAVFYGGQYHGAYPDWVIETIIGGLTFYWPDGYPIRVWNNGVIYDLSDAFEIGLLNSDVLDSIHENQFLT